MIKYDVKATGIDLTPAIRAHVEEKLSQIEKFLDKRDESIYAQVEVSKTTDHHQKGEIFRGEINLHVSGKDLRAEATDYDLYTALNAVREEIEKNLLRLKTKRESRIRRGARKLKELLRGLGRGFRK